MIASILIHGNFNINDTSITQLLHANIISTFIDYDDISSSKYITRCFDLRVIDQHNNIVEMYIRIYTMYNDPEFELKNHALIFSVECRHSKNIKDNCNRLHGFTESYAHSTCTPMHNEAELAVFRHHEHSYQPNSIGKFLYDTSKSYSPFDCRKTINERIKL